MSCWTKQGMRRRWPIPADTPMLLELQMQFRRAMLGGDTTEIVSKIREDELAPEARLQIYRNHVFATLGAALEGTFPTVCRLVDARFLATPRTNICANARRIHAASSNMAPSLRISSPGLSHARICPIW